MRIIRTAAGLPVKQAAGHIGIQKLARVRILKLVQAAMAAAIAQCLPLLLIELSQWLLPEMHVRIPA